MVDQKRIEEMLSRLEADRLEDKWTVEKEKKFQYLLEIYRTGKFLNVNYNQLITELESVTSKYCK